MVLSKRIREYKSTDVVSYVMYELHYSSGIDNRYTVKKLYTNATPQVLVAPVSREIAEMVWNEIVVPKMKK